MVWWKTCCPTRFFACSVGVLGNVWRPLWQLSSEATAVLDTGSSLIAGPFDEVGAIAAKIGAVCVRYLSGSESSAEYVSAGPRLRALLLVAPAVSFFRLYHTHCWWGLVHTCVFSPPRCLRVVPFEPFVKKTRCCRLEVVFCCCTVSVWVGLIHAVGVLGNASDVLLFFFFLSRFRRRFGLRFRFCVSSFHD